LRGNFGIDLRMQAHAFRIDFSAMRLAGEGR
jgi:hypothetical protein